MSYFPEAELVSNTVERFEKTLSEKKSYTNLVNFGKIDLEAYKYSFSRISECEPSFFYQQPYATTVIFIMYSLL